MTNEKQTTPVPAPVGVWVTDRKPTRDDAGPTGVWEKAVWVMSNGKVCDVSWNSAMFRSSRIEPWCRPYALIYPAPYVPPKTKRVPLEPLEFIGKMIAHRGQASCVCMAIGVSEKEIRLSSAGVYNPDDLMNEFEEVIIRDGKIVEVRELSKEVVE